MLARASTAFVLALPVFAAATALPRTDGGGGPSSQCNTGTAQCCNSAQAATSPSASALLGLLGIAVDSVTGLVGITCSPITVIGGSGTSCSQQPVCCTNNSFHGLIALGCTPININV